MSSIPYRTPSACAKWRRTRTPHLIVSRSVCWLFIFKVTEPSSIERPESTGSKIMFSLSSVILFWKSAGDTHGARGRGSWRAVSGAVRACEQQTLCRRPCNKRSASVNNKRSAGVPATSALQASMHAHICS
jgi:hypothetical protein